MEATERFADLVGGGGAFPLDEAALLVGAHADPTCDVDGDLRRLDRLAGMVATPSLPALLRVVFVDEGFLGDEVDYDDPRNSYLHEVLRRHRGIPITLSVVLVEVGRRIGVTLEPIGTPAHFLVRSPEPSGVYVDAFAGGRVLDRADLDAFFARLAPGIALEPFLVPLAPTQVVRRILGNLVAIHRRRSDRDGLLWSTRLRTLLADAAAGDRRAYGGALAAAGDFAQAARVLEAIVEDGEAADPDAELLRAQRLRARLN